MVECQPSKHKTLSSTPNTTKKKKKKERNIKRYPLELNERTPENSFEIFEEIEIQKKN
jgi:hypothetical protein